MRPENLVAVSLMAVSLCSASVASGADRIVLLASTIGPVDAGIVQVLEDRFEAATGIRVRHVGAGTGQALKVAETGNVDLVMVHARALEEEFVKNGFGTRRIPFMYNDFVIVGPAADPAGIKAATSAAEALKTIAARGAPFVTRGDKSGTHVAELELWAKAGISPAGPWYIVYEKGSEGNKATLKFTDEKQAYTVMDRATWLSLKGSLKLVVLVEKDPALLNYISLIPVNPRKFPKVNHKGAATFVKWLTSMDGQRIVEEFGRSEYGEPLFFPDSDEWKASRAKQK